MLATSTTSYFVLCKCIYNNKLHHFTYQSNSNQPFHWNSQTSIVGVAVV